MKERPIIFSAPMVRAILEGRKTQTRRVCNGQRELSNVRDFRIDSCPYGQPGDRLWVRESFIHEPAEYCWEASVSTPCQPASTVYRADHDGDTRGAGWSSPIHMPRSLSRITLEIVSVRVEHLRDISDEDSLAEGIYPTSTGLYHGSPRAEYRKLWEQINGPGSWDANPWVWAVEFKAVTP